MGLPKSAAVAFLIAIAPHPAASGAPIEWEIREAHHPALGPIHFAFTRTPLTTRVGISQVSSQVYVSCERATGRIAIELANAQAPGDPRGLPPRSLPKLLCKRAPRVKGAGTVQEELAVRWDFNDIGDVLARGLRPEELLACTSLGVVQEVALPKGWSQPSARLVFDIAPAGTQLQPIIAGCGKPRDASTTVAAAPEPSVTPPPQKGSAAKPAPPAEADAAGWQRARTTTAGKTNVRARPSTEAEVVAHLPPNATVLVRKRGGDWWRVKASAGGSLEGYVREDRLVFR